MREVTLHNPGDFTEWRSAARPLLAAGVPPQEVLWRHAGESGSLFADSANLDPKRTITLPRELVTIADRVICHRDPAVPSRLYRVVWRALDDRRLLERRTDPDVDWLAKMDKAIRRDLHKMHAFVRFRRLGGSEADRESYVAWFEPEHRILRLAAPFFRKRFYGMDWAILTPDARAIWQSEELSFGPAGTRDEVPDRDIVEDQWRTYYGAIFNPARVKIAAMRAEMPKKYWHNLPEAQDIAPLLAGAAARVDKMRETAVSLANPRSDKWRVRGVAQDAEPGDAIRSLEDISAALKGCTRCPLHCHATQPVPGEGRADARIMLVGEQPGDREDLEGRPFVGPAGQLLDEALAEAGLDRATLYVTNAVKHFKFEPRGKRRLHQNPNTGEIDICRWWLDQERALVQPDIIVSLGGSALRGITGKSPSISSMRGKVHALEGGAQLIATVHPSYLLRLPDQERAAIERRAFIADLARAKAMAESLPNTHGNPNAGFA
ncbi:UdgX family uracil-DNA binding protein [Blastomonas sp. AAP53]|uniref:UdgX family uracil-DNA binding protein n=1 Tax=Blastomonas sp. AAP53 TaxID=1248760 RepID=UPI0002E50081|nr:UdgX family uracil-DNA binding protein [Blastomonas sp. AAP53]